MDPKQLAELQQLYSVSQRKRNRPQRLAEMQADDYGGNYGHGQINGNGNSNLNPNG